MRLWQGGIASPGAACAKDGTVMIGYAKTRTTHTERAVLLMLAAPPHARTPHAGPLFARRGAARRIEAHGINAAAIKPV